MKRQLASLGVLALVACHGQVLSLGSGAQNIGGASDSGPGAASGDGGLLPAGPVVVNKVDLLFMIDNSASMGDKQLYLEKAIPDLLTRLVTPNCLSATDNSIVLGISTPGSDGAANCNAFANATLEFPAVHDLHIGIVSSSLGPRLGDVAVDGNGGECPQTDPLTLPDPTTGAPVTIDRHNDDHAYLITRTASPPDPTEGTLADNAASTGFLAWFPNVAANQGSGATAGTSPVTSPATLISDFTDLIAGVHPYGCGIESQLESWYRFLIQPDPYQSLTLGSATAGSAAPAQWVGVDTTIIKQRHDFLRPDSLVAIIDLTDENDSEIDVRSIGGQGYLWMSTSFHPNPGTAACTDPTLGPNDPGCTIDQSASASQYTSPEDWGYDLNLRHVHMKEKYGLDPQFPISRYVNGLTSAKVPDRTGEYPTQSDGSLAPSYVGNNNCTNPLFAASLPDGSELSASVGSNETASDAAALCNLPVTTTRPQGLVFFTIIGGVPWQLLHFDPTSAANSALSTNDWVRIQGKNPDTFNYAGIDPHMIESYQPRTSSTFATASLLPAVSGSQGSSAAETAPADPTGANTDPYNGREWNTNTSPNHIDLKVDRQYACIFKLVDPASGDPTPRDCSNDGTGNNYAVPANGPACDCSSTVGSGATDITPDQLPPVCDPANPNSQLYAKAYPTSRELNLASKLGAQGIVGSICPIDVSDNTTGDDPLFGYRPVVAQLVNQMKGALAYTGK